MSRRQSLAALSTIGLTPWLFRDPVQNLIDNLVQGVFMRAQADPSGPASNYVYFSDSGGRAPWYFYSMNPRGDSAFSKNRQVNTRFADAANYSTPIHATHPVATAAGTLHLPYLWASQMPAAGGGWIPMTNALQNLLMIRGVSFHRDGHDNNTPLYVRPVSGEPSIGGLVQAQGGAPLAAVTGGGVNDQFHKSPTGESWVRVQGGSNPLIGLLQPFQRGSGDISGTQLSRRSAMNVAMDRALASLGTLAASNTPGAAALHGYRTNAETILRNGIGDISTVWTSLLAKYSDLADRAFQTFNILGVNDKPVPNSSSRGENALPLVDGAPTFCQNTDLRTIFTTQTYLHNLAENMAIAEYLLTYGYSNSFIFGTEGLNGMNFEGLPEFTRYYTDEHSCGSSTSLLANSQVYRAVTACMYELVQALKRASMFDRTVIQIGSEMGRDARDTFNSATQPAMGADHGWSGNCTAIWSGKLPSDPLLLGNVYIDMQGYHGNRRGTWGNAAPIQVAGIETLLDMGHVSSTVCHLLGVNPITNNPTLLQASGSGTMQPAVETARNVVYVPGMIFDYEG